MKTRMSEKITFDNSGLKLQTFQSAVNEINVIKKHSITQS